MSLALIRTILSSLSIPVTVWNLSIRGHSTFCAHASSNDDQLDGAEKDGPTGYGLFVAPDAPEEQAQARQNAVSAISLFMEAASQSL